MPTMNVTVTLFNGVTDTVAADFQRAEKIFAAVPLKFTITKFSLDRSQTRAILGADGKLATTGGATTFTHDLPAGAARTTPESTDFGFKDGAFTSEVWKAIKDWTDIGNLHVFYVKGFDPPGSEGGICLRAQDKIDPIIFVSDPANRNLLQKTKSARGIVEHEIGHSFGLPDVFAAGRLMNGIISSDGSDAGIMLNPGELSTIQGSRLLSLATP